MDGSNTQIVGVIFAGANLLLTTVLLFVVADLRARIHRMEDLHLRGKG